MELDIEKFKKLKKKKEKMIAKIFDILQESVLTDLEFWHLLTHIRSSYQDAHHAELKKTCDEYNARKGK